MPTVKVVIEQDSFPFDPRENETLGTMICFHRRYNLGDKHKLSLEQAMVLERNKDVIALPLYLYDHSGITMATTPFNCHWDSGKVGFIYVTKKQAREWYSVKAITKKVRDRIIEALQCEVKEYDHYLRGNVYCMTEYDENGNDGYCCGGYIGTVDEVVEVAKSSFLNAEIVVA